MLNFIKKHRKGLRLVFMLAVFALVVFEFGVLSKEFSLTSLRSYMASYGLGFIFAILALGLVSPLPMIGYDLSLLAYEGIELDRRSLVEKSYLVNAYNNMIGTGGLLSLALRYEFYADKTESKEDFTKKITRITPYFLSGLSVLSLVGLGALILARIGLVGQGLLRLRAYWIVLLIISLYLALILYLSNKSKLNFLGGLPKKVQGQQILISILEWVFLFMNFYIISRLMDIRVGILYQLVAFTAASALGLVSQVPGGLGSFEIIIITAMARSGLDEELIASWLIFYRLSAYVAPFVLGSVFFAKHIGKSLNDKFNAMPKRIFKEVLHKLNSGLILLYGLNQVLTVLDPPYLERLSWLRSLPLARWNVVGRFPGLLLGFLFILLARLSWDKQKSMTKALGLLGLVTLVSQIFKGEGFIGILPILIILGLAFYTKEVLNRDKFIYSWEYMTIDLGLGALIIFSYMYKMGQTSSQTMAISPGVKLISLVFMALILFASAYLLMSLARSRDTIGKKPDLVELEDFMESYGPGKSTHAGLSYLGDKYIYYYENENREKTVAFQFAKINNKVIVLGQPFGKKEDMGPALASFIGECDRLSYQPVFYEVSRHLALDLHDYGYDFIKFGEEAIVDLGSWNLDGHKNASKRNTLNRFKKDGFSFDIASPPHSEGLMKDLKNLSDIWLGSRGERRFSLGFFKEDYIQRSKLGLVKNSAGDLIAFVSLMPMGESKTLTLDLMRYDSSTSPNSTMDFIFLSLMFYGRDEGYDYLTLGMAPLSMVGTMKTSYTSEKIAHMVYKYAGRIYSFKGLRAYKDKYASFWIPRYTSNAPGNWLLYSMLALVLVGRRPLEGVFKISLKEK